MRIPVGKLPPIDWVKVGKAIAFVGTSAPAVWDAIRRIRSQNIDATRQYDGKTLPEWDRSWESLGTLASENWRGIRDIGVYRFSRPRKGVLYIGRVVYTGRIVLRRGGFHWRFQQYCAGSHAGNTTPSAKQIHADADVLEVDILRMKTKSAVAALEMAMISKYQPPWNEKGK